MKHCITDKDSHLIIEVKFKISLTELYSRSSIYLNCKDRKDMNFTFTTKIKDDDENGSKNSPRVEFTDLELR